MVAFRHTDQVTLSAVNSAAVDKSHLPVQRCSACARHTADCKLMDCKMNLVELDCDCMDGCYSVNYTFAAAADNGDA